MEINGRRFPFEIRGKLRTTPEQALKLFGFRQRADALGIVVQMGNNGKFRVRNLMPKKSRTAGQELMNKKVKLLAAEWHSLSDAGKQTYNMRASKLKRNVFSLFWEENWR